MPYAYQCRWCKGPPLPQQWEGACPNCGGFYRAVQVTVRKGETLDVDQQVVDERAPIAASALVEMVNSEELGEKRPSGMQGVDWVFDGGLPSTGAILLCGGEGSGKTTFLLELFRKLAKKRVDTLFISTEQRRKQLGLLLSRFGRVPEKHMAIHSECDKDEIMRVIEECQPQVVALDSLHDLEKVKDEEGRVMANGEPKTLTRAAKEFRRMAEDLELLCFLVGHLNNDGTLKGGSNLRHELDGSLVIRRTDDEKDPRRLMEFARKTRFGVLGRRALFMMTETGFKDVGPVGDDFDLDRSRGIPVKKKDFDVN